MSSAQPIIAAVAEEKSEMFIFPKLLYFVFNLMNYSLHTFQSQIFEEKWYLHMKEIAFANMLQVSSFIGSLFWTWFADKTGRSKIIVGFSCVLFALIWSLLFLPARYVV